MSQDHIETNDIIPGLSLARMTPTENLKPQSGILTGEACFFPVHVETLVIPSSGKESPIRAIINSDSGEQVGQYMREGSLVPNADLVEQFEQGLRDAGYEFAVKYTCYGEGARFIAEYTLTSVHLNLGDDSGAALKLTLKNSYNGQWSITLGRMVERLICLNGMVSRVQELSLCKKHSSRIDVVGLAFNIDSLVTGAEDEIAAFLNMRRYSLNNQQALTFLANAVRYGKGAISKGLASRIAIAHRMGDETDGDENDLWRLHNAGTRVFRDMRGVRPENAMKAGKMWSDLCVLAANPDISNYAKTAWDRMLAPPKNEHRLIDV